ncbi:acyl-CoA dehydrogenase family protein [Nocardia huaxiensis]|uniref:acyl-CoA dehydrogenase family protein n=1 Tax=Nocardia huaxiensis TaxID=2755382 RepID=UPI001E62995C|nr:acyl-CoA dehydrogenase family protein [Nocardia huaxiensis]UFS98531.1 acyl-CoA/acyl-ACP dehydrogenase [Nocardia huaxiensis]
MPRTITDTIGTLADPGSDSDERAQLRAVLARMIAEVAPPERVRELDENEEFDHELHKQLAAMGILALGGSPEDGGYGDGRDQLVAVEELAAGPTSTAVFLIVHYMAVQILSTCASAEQRETVLAPLMSGEVKVSFALTEAGGGTDVARAMRTRAERTADGWRLNGSKTWISGAQICDYLVVLARTAPLTESSIDGITMFLVPRDTPGVEVRELPTVAVHGYDTNDVRFDDVILPANAIVGEVDSGFRQVIAVLNRERLNAAAGAVGAARGALEASVRYATEREAFGKHLGTMQAVQHRLVDGALAIEAARSLMIRAAEIEVAGGRADILSSMAKIVASEAAVKVTQDGMLMFAGAGFSREFPIQRWFRDVRLWTFAPLTNDMARNYLGERYLGLGRSY